jgi:hypothetical protein
MLLCFVAVPEQQLLCRLPEPAAVALMIQSVTEGSRLGIMCLVAEQALLDRLNVLACE